MIAVRCAILLMGPLLLSPVLLLSLLLLCRTHLRRGRWKDEYSYDKGGRLDA